MRTSDFEFAIRRSRPRRAFTLVEVLLTMALLVIIAGMTWVSLQRPFARQKVRSAADAVRSQLTAGRLDAMKSGHTYAFRYVVHGDRYHLAPQDGSATIDSSPAAQPAAPASSTAQSSAADEDAMGDDPLPPPVDKRLPQGVRFLPDADGGDIASQDEPATEAAGGDGWSDPIYFYADGTTSDARLLLAADGHAALRLFLRGITGTVTVDEVTAMTQ